MQSAAIPEQVDVAIIGAGIAGLGIALALRHQGHAVAVFEKAEPVAATSAYSLRIIHGGFRYLQSLDVGRCLRSAKDQIQVLARYPHAVEVLPCVLPLRKGSLRSPLPLMFASSLYSVARAMKTGTLTQAGRVHRRNSGAQFESLPGYGDEGLFAWDDVLIRDPAALVESIMFELESAGIRVWSHFELRRGQSGEGGQQLVFQTPTGEQAVAARCVVNAAGPWVSEVSARLGCPSPFPDISWVRAVNVIVQRQFEARYGIAFEGENGALYFMTPRGRHSAIGTFYSAYTGPMDAEWPSNEDVVELLGRLNRALPQLELHQSDVVAIDAGLLPATDTSQAAPILLGSERIQQEKECVHVLSTKFTTFLSQGERVAQRVKNILH